MSIGQSCILTSILIGTMRVTLRMITMKMKMRKMRKGRRKRKMPEELLVRFTI